MGMFDMIEDKLFCPFCGKQCEEGDYQTKDLECMCDTWKIEDIIKFCDKDKIVNIYHKCNHCNKWIELKLTVRLMKNE